MGEKIFSASGLKSNRKFTGRVVGHDWEQGEYGEKLVLKVQNLDRPERVEPVLVRVKYGESKQSTWGIFIKRLETLGVKMTTGPEQLVGLTFVFDEEDLKFGNKADSMVKQQILPQSIVQA